MREGRARLRATIWPLSGSGPRRRRVIPLENDSSPQRWLRDWRGDKLQHYAATRYHHRVAAVDSVVTRPPHPSCRDEERVTDTTVPVIASTVTSSSSSSATYCVVPG